MELRGFAIGRAFAEDGHSLWLRADTGSRVVVAIRLDRAETVSVVVRGGEPGPETHAVVDPREDRGWLSGPPYALADEVFDEHALPVCRAVAEHEVAAWTPEDRRGGVTTGRGTGAA